MKIFVMKILVIILLVFILLIILPMVIVFGIIRLIGEALIAISDWILGGIKDWMVEMKKRLTKLEKD